MPSEPTLQPGPKRAGLLACTVLAVVLLGTAGVLTSVDPDAGRVTADPTEQDESRVTITSPEANATYAHADIIRIDLEFEEAETAVLTLENISNAGLDPVTFHVTVEDANGSGNATVYFNPFSNS